MNLTSVEQFAPLFASLTLASLGAVSLASGRRETVWRLIATFCFLLTGATGLAFLVPLTRNGELALLYARVAPRPASSPWSTAVTSRSPAAPRGARRWTSR